MARPMPEAPPVMMAVASLKILSWLLMLVRLVLVLDKF
jgi:hypothetical protein